MNKKLYNSKKDRKKNQQNSNKKYKLLKNKNKIMLKRI